jgi:hypothetical protein
MQEVADCTTHPFDARRRKRMLGREASTKEGELSATVKDNLKGSK